MSRLAPGLIELNKGLDLNTAKIAAPEGTLLDMLNYEQVDFQGQKRIDGYVRYDGSKGSYIDDFLVLVSSGEWAADPGALVYVGSELMGVLVGMDWPHLYVAVIDETKIPSSANVQMSLDGAIGTPTAIMWGRDVLEMPQTGEPITPQEHYDLLLQLNQVLRSRTTDLPGPIAGLHWFRDRLYAVAAVPAVPGWDVYPNQTYNGYPVLEARDGLIYLGTAETIPGQENSEIASFFVSRSEAQAKAELGSAWLYGWEFNHLGWQVPYTDGISAYGSLPSLNQNIQGVGTQGPSSITGENGKALAVRQKVNIAGSLPQVNGWKPSDNSTTYNIREDHIANIDSLYLYADAFVSWDGETGEVNAPGFTDSALVEYSPTASIEVEVN